MRSVAGLLKLEGRRTLAALDAGERVVLAPRLGARDLEAFRCAAHDSPLTPADADRLFRRRRQPGRRPSPCLRELIG
jgi:hypothetical protein